jgi:hypothetical protein
LAFKTEGYTVIGQRLDKLRYYWAKTERELQWKIKIVLQAKQEIVKN